MISSKLLLIAAIIAFGNGAPAAETDQPSSTFENCLKQIEPKVCDPQNVLKAEDKQKLDEVLAELEKKTQQEGYAADTLKRKDKCGPKGIMTLVIMSKENGMDPTNTENKLNEMNKKWTTDHPCDRVTILMLNAAEKIEQRRFWAGRNWNVNVEPGEMVNFYKKEIPNIKAAEYFQAMMNMLQQLMQTVLGRAPNAAPVGGQSQQQQQVKMEQMSAAEAETEKGKADLKKENEAKNEKTEGEQKDVKKEEGKQ